MDRCKNGVKESERKILDNCWVYFYDIFKCSESYRELNDTQKEWPCQRENDVIMDCITKVVGKSIKDD